MLFKRALGTDPVSGKVVPEQNAAEKAKYLKNLQGKTVEPLPGTAA